MNEPSPLSVSSQDERPEPQAHRVVARLRRVLSKSDPGTLAALRRADATRPPPPAFFRVTVDILDEEGAPKEDVARAELERRWLVILSAMATGLDLLEQVRLGEALARAGVAEMRLLKLLNARTDALYDAIRNVVHQLVSKAQSFDARDLADLVLSDGNRTWEDAVRRRVARDYYRHAET